MEIEGPSEAPSQSHDLGSEACPPVLPSMRHADSDAEPSRSQYFEDLLDEINSCQCYAELEAAISSSMIRRFPLPEYFPNTVVDVSGQIDKMSLQFRPDTLTALYPVWTKADGNCLPRAAGILVFGDQDQYRVEIRCRIISELVAHKSLYVQGEGMGGPDVAAQVAAISNSSTVSGTASPGAIGKIFEKEVMEVRNCEVPMGLWQLAALANLLGTSVRSVYPSLGWTHYQMLSNRTLFPRKTEHKQKLTILWTSNRCDMQDQHWVANHFVP